MTLSDDDTNRLMSLTLDSSSCTVIRRSTSCVLMRDSWSDDVVDSDAVTDLDLTIFFELDCATSDPVELCRVAATAPFLVVPLCNPDKS